MARSELFARNQPGGVFSIAGITEHPNEIFFVHSGTGTDAAGYGQSPDAPVASLDYAIGLCTASKGDVIYCLPGHAETTTAIALDVAGVKIVGLGFGANRPTLTSTAAATDLILVSAANCEIHNMRLIGAASDCTALVDIGAADVSIVGCELVQAATPLIGVTVSAGDRFRIEGCKFRGSANGPDYAVSIEAKVHDWIIRRCDFLYASGLDNGVLKSVKACTGYLISDIYVVGVDTLLVDLASSSAGAPDGLLSDGYVMASAALTSIEDMVAAATSKGLAFGRVLATDATGKRGGNIPLTSAS